MSRLPILFICLLLAAGMATGMAAAETSNVPELQRLLQSNTVQKLRFREVRESPWLSNPVESTGILQTVGDSLEKRILSPKQEVWRLLRDRLEWVGAAGRKEVLFSNAPALSILANTMRRLVAGDLVALEKDFHIKVQGPMQSWVANMAPSSAAARQYFESLEIRGEGGQLTLLTILDRQGERTTLHLFP